MTSSESQPRTAAIAFAEQGHCASDCCDWYPHLHVHGEKAEYLRWLAEAAQDSRPLDVERLAKALSETWGGTPPNWSSDGRFAPERAKRAFAAEAELVAAAYARLAAEEPHD